MAKKSTNKFRSDESDEDPSDSRPAIPMLGLREVSPGKFDLVLASVPAHGCEVLYRDMPKARAIDQLKISQARLHWGGGVI